MDMLEAAAEREQNRETENRPLSPELECKDDKACCQGCVLSESEI